MQPGSWTKNGDPCPPNPPLRHKRRAPRFCLFVLIFLGTFLPGCMGVSSNPSYFPYFRRPGDIIRTHGKPAGLGYYGNFDPHAVRVEVRPLVAVSPVRKHYVLVATVYDEDGKPRRNRRVEWMLEGAGNIIEVDESGYFPGRGYKVDNHYAVSYTNYAEHQVTRGNTDPSDDFVLRPGQSWCVISSAIEGDTHVTVYCPEIYNWQNNKVVVTTHWVDVDWAFPQPVAIRSGSPHVLTTTLTRSTDRQPLAGYRVRYRILEGGTPGVFLPGGGSEAVAISDLRGQANVTLAQAQPGSSGPTRIGIEVIRAPDPSRTSDSGLPLAKGETTVDWQAPVVTLDLAGPPSVVVGQELAHTITLSNTGQVETRGLTIRCPIPEGLEPLRSDPPALLEGRELVWTLGEVGPKQTRTIQSLLRTSRETTRLGPVTALVRVQTAEGLRGEKSISTEVVAEPRPALKARITGPPTALLDGSYTCEVVLSNPGTGLARDVVLKAAFDQGLSHESNFNPVEARIGPLDPGMSKSITLTLRAKGAGRQTVRVTASAEQNLQDTAEHSLLVQRAVLSLENQGPLWRYAGRPATWTIRARNNGEVPLTGVAVRYTLPPELEFRSATAGGMLQGTEVSWMIGPLDPGQIRDLEVTTVCRALVDKAVTVARATADGGPQAEVRAELEIRGLPAVRMRVVDAEDPIASRGITEYRIEVTNQGTLPGHEVRIVGFIPPEMKVRSALGPTPATTQEQRVVFGPLTTLPPGQTVTYRISVEALKSGVHYFRAELTTQTIAQPIVEEESTIVLPSPGEPGFLPKKDPG